MDSAEVGKYIESVAVRIGFHDGGSLAGTGVLYNAHWPSLIPARPFCLFGAKAGRKIFFWSWLIQATIKQLIFTIVRVL